MTGRFVRICSMFLVNKGMISYCLKATVSILFCSILTLADATASEEVVPGQYLLKYDDDLTVEQRHVISGELGLYLIKEYSASGEALLAGEHTRKPLDRETIKDLLAAGVIEYFEPNFRVYSVASPNDTRFNEQWGLSNNGSGGTTGMDIDATRAWDITTGSAEIVIGVVDSGVAANHPDLKDNMWVNPGERSTGSDTDGNGVADDINGYNAIARNGNPNDDNGHGTHCAGIIAASGNNGSGVSGVTWNSKIMSLKFLDSQGSGSVAHAIDAIDYAIKQKQRGVNIRVLNNSWGGSSYSSALENAIRAARDNNILFVVAAGNSASNNDTRTTYPANYNLENVVSVAAIDRNGNLASFSNYGNSKVHIGAPGVGILSTYLNNTYANLSGTSMAAPFVSGIAALILSREPALSAAQLKSRLLGSARPLASLNNVVSSGGLASASRALGETQTPTPPTPVESSYSSKRAPFELDADFGTRISQGDDEYIAADLPFSFDYFGTTFNRIAISTNGRILPLASGENLPTAPDYASAVYPGINALNHDYVSAASSDGGVWLKIGVGKATITWVVRPYLYASNSDLARELRFQASIFANGNIAMQYIKTNVGNTDLDYGARATVSLAPLPDQGGERLVVSNNQANENLLGNEKAFVLTPGRKAAFSDFDGDGVSDIIVWRPSSGMWYILLSSKDFSFSEHVQIQLGLPGDKPRIGDFDGDRKSDLVVWRPSNGTWYIRSSKSNYSEITGIQWGLPQDNPLTGDFDGDGVSDISVYRPAQGSYFTLLSSTGYNREGALSGNPTSFRHVRLGGPGNDPIVADFSGNGVDDYGSIWQLHRFWTIKDIQDRVLFSLPWGMPGDTPLACDRDQDGRADRFMVRVNSENRLDWFGFHSGGTVEVKNFGSLGDIPGCKHDTRGNKNSQLMLYRPQSGEWFISENSDTSIRKIQFGLPGDIPILD